MEKRIGKLSGLLLGGILLIMLLSLTAYAGEKVTDVSAEKYSSGFDEYQIITILHDGYVSGITEIRVDDVKWEEVSVKISLFGSGKYYLDKENEQIFFYGSSVGNGSRIVIQNGDYEDLVLDASSGSGSFDVTVVESDPTPAPDPDPTPAPDPDPTPGNDKKAAPNVATGKVSEGFYAFQAVTIEKDSEYLSGITGISVNGTLWSSTASKISVYGTGMYYIDSDVNAVYFDGTGSGALKIGDVIVIQNPGYEDLTLTVTAADNGSFSAGTDGEEPDPDPTPDPTPDPDPDPMPGDDKKAAPDVTAGTESGYQVLAIQNADGYVDGITEVAVNGTAWEKKDYKISLWGTGAYWPDSGSNALYFDGSGSSGALKNNDIITIKNPEYEDLLLKITNADGVFSAEPYDPSEPVPTDVLYVRLTGYFEAALKGQEKYDAISGASTSVSANKNSNVIVQAVILPDGQIPTEDDWIVLNSDSGIRIDTDKSKTYVSIDEASGMIGVYSTYDGSLTLAGTPKTPGEYKVSVTVTDEQGHTATSNELIFKVYEGTETLADQLKLENAKQTEDGKYMYDMEPWAISVFGGTDETVTVPEEIKAWYGSHTSGTYGELGYAVSGEPVQTLIVPAGCNLTLVNMKILSSVKIIVENGGKLVLRDSSVHGQIVVNDGGSFSMNYDDYEGKFLTGASINGQLILNDGATLENSSIYSNTNYLPNGSEVRHNTEPVVLVTGNVSVEGQVFIRGDEAATGTDPETGKSYSGQPAIKIENGTLNIPDGSVVAAFGGGKDATTSVGGTAAILDNGTITGDGKLIAVGGAGTGDDGGNAVSGTGVISVKDAYLEGGSTYFPKDDTIEAGKAMESTVTLSASSNRNLIDGKVIKGNQDSGPDTYWRDITTVPDLALYVVEANAPGSSSGGDDEQKPGDETNPGDTGNGDETNPGDTGNGDETNPGDTGNGDETNPGDTGNGDETNPGDTGNGDETNPGDTGNGDETNPGDTGNGDETNPEDTGNGDETNPGDTGNEDETNPGDTGNGDETNPGGTGNGDGTNSGDTDTDDKDNNDNNDNSGSTKHHSSGSSSADSSGNASAASSTEGANTGDDTNIALYIFLLLAASVSGIVAKCKFYKK